MKNQRLSEGKVEVADEVVAVDGNVQLTSLLLLSFLEGPHRGLNLDRVRLKIV